jgi:hypothetical protein
MTNRTAAEGKGSFAEKDVDATMIMMIIRSPTPLA